MYVRDESGGGVDRYAVAWISAVQHVDHLHPDWGIALAAKANGHEKLKEFNERLWSQDDLGAVAAARV